ncbi:hypothetical protein HZC27_00650 [Candidatus Roizmanbacteria bacterium]|nr:hypothetical protein [Candidatus Roizmanbacteria bacterium]
MLDSPDVPRVGQLTERVATTPLAHYSRNVLDRLRVVQYLWSYENSKFLRTRNAPVNTNDIQALQTHVAMVFEKDDGFYAKPDTHTRPEWEDGLPTHPKAVPLNYDPLVIQNGIGWYNKLKAPFNEITHKLGGKWGSDTVISYLIDQFEKRLMELAYKRSVDLPLNFLDQNVLINFVLGTDKQNLFSIDEANVSIVNTDSTTNLHAEAKLIGEKIARDNEIAKPLFEKAFRDVLIDDSLTNLQAETRVMSHELDAPTQTQIFQVPHDGVGADVVSSKNNRIVVVDGEGFGNSGKRMKAERLAKKLLDTDEPLTTTESYIALEFKNDEMIIRARGGYVVIWNVNTSNLLEPKVVYSDDDSVSLKDTQEKIDIRNARYVAIFTDGGIDLLGENVLFGHSKDFSRNAHEAVESIGMGGLNKKEVVGYLEYNLLEPITNLLNANSNHQTMPENVKMFFNEMQQNKPKLKQMHDDATFTFTCLGKEA